MIPDNKFHFWRVLVAAAHTDHTVTSEERDFIIEKFQYIDFSSDQKSQLLSELDNPQDLKALFVAIESPEERAECLYMIHNLAHADGELHPMEQKLYEILKENHLNTLDKNAIRADFQKFLEDQKVKNEKIDTDIRKLRNQSDLMPRWKRWFV